MDPKEGMPKTGLFKSGDTVFNSDVHTRLHELVGDIKPDEASRLKEFFPGGETTTESGMLTKLDELHWKNENLKREGQYEESHKVEKTLAHLRTMLGNH